MSPSSHPLPLTLQAGTHALCNICNCGASGNKPFCDGSHQRHSA